MMPTLTAQTSPVTSPDTQLAAVSSHSRMATFNFVNHSVTLTARKKTRLRQTLDPRQVTNHRPPSGHVTPCSPLIG